MSRRPRSRHTPELSNYMVSLYTDRKPVPNVDRNFCLSYLPFSLPGPQNGAKMPYNTTAIPPRKDPTGHTQLPRKSRRLLFPAAAPKLLSRITDNNLLPVSRVKKIIAADPEISTCSNNAAFIITLAAEMFVQHFTKQASAFARSDHKKPRRNIQYRDMASAVAHDDRLEFLEDIVPRALPFREAKKVAAEARARISAAGGGGGGGSGGGGETKGKKADEHKGPKKKGPATAGNAKAPAELKRDREKDKDKDRRKEKERERKPDVKGKAKANGIMPRIVAGADREDRMSPDASDQLHRVTTSRGQASNAGGGVRRDRDGDVKMGG